MGLGCRVGNDSIVRELAYTGRNMDSEEALRLGLVGKIFPTKEDCWAAAKELALQIAERSPVAVVGTKISLNYSRDHTTQVSSSQQHCIILVPCFS